MGRKISKEIIIENKIYDVTNFLKFHPGGKNVLLKKGGKDVTEEFITIHPYGVIEAYLNKDQPDLVELKNVHSFTKLNDGSTLSVKADKANYYKKSKNIKYYQNVKILNKDGIITAKIANFLSDKNLIRLEQNVIYKDNKNTIKGDIAELNTMTNNLEIFMLKEKDRVYGKRK